MSSLQYNEIFDARKLQYIINNWDSISFSDSEIKENNDYVIKESKNILDSNLYLYSSFLSSSFEDNIYI